MKRELTLKERFKAETPKFWKQVQKIGLTAGAIGMGILAAPVTLPATIIGVAGYLTLAGTLTGILSQLTVDDNAIKDEK